MPRRPRHFSFASAIVLALLASAASRTAYAQFGGGMGGGMRPGSQPGAAPGSSGPSEQKDGPAEQAPDDKSESPALQPLPAWPAQKEKATQFFQLNGYIRMRAYLFHNLNLGYYQGQGTPVSPFFIPFSEYGQTGKVADNGAPSSCAQREQSNCRTSNLTSADMRLRLEPTINVTDQVRVHAQFDVFDNMVLGSSPDTYSLNGLPTAVSSVSSLYSNNAQSQVSGQNSVLSSIQAKRAWAEVHTPYAELSFGRMPSHWGMGMLTNNGDCLDCDYGSTVDRVMVSTRLWGHFFTFMWDWVATGPTTQIIGPQTGQGVFYNADTLDDTSQWILAMGKIDKPEALKEKLDKGRIVTNYGGYFVYRQQDWTEAQGANPPATTGNTYQQLQNSLVPRKAKEFIGDLYLRVDWKKLHLEAEGAIVAGKVGDLADVYPNYSGSTLIVSGGFAFKGHYKLLAHDALKIYLEVGYASGDSSEDPSAQLNYRYQNLQPINNRIGRFEFDPDYHVDLILFRRILGAVNDAAYFKPGISYDILDNFTARADIMYALAANPVSYPGNSYNLGLEIDAALMYKNEEEGFYAGVAYGVLFPFAALSFPASIYGGFAHDASTAQTFQGRIAVRF
jgi:uncharacterized protein (TIGR04551 family)